MEFETDYFKNKAKLMIWLPKWMIKELRKTRNQSHYIEKLITQHSGWKKPENKK